MCQPKSTFSLQTESEGEIENGDIRANRPAVGDETEGENLAFLSSPLTVKSINSIAKRRHARTRDGRFANFLVFPTGAIEQEDDIMAESITSEQLQLSFSCLPALLGADGIMQAIISFCTDLNYRQGPIMPQGLCDYTEYATRSVKEKVRFELKKKRDQE